MRLGIIFPTMEIDLRATSNPRGPRIGGAASAPYRGEDTAGTDPAVEARIRQIIAANR